MSHTSLLFEIEIFLTLLACLLQYFRGKSYASKDHATLPKAVMWSVLWSLVTSWSLILAGNGHAGVALPVPSTLALVYLWQDSSLSPTDILFLNEKLNARATIILSALLPIFAYLAAYRKYGN